MIYSFEKSLGRITHQVSKGLGEKLVRKFSEHNLEIDSYQWTIISYLYHNQKAIQNDIAKFMGLNKVRVMRILDILEENGYIKRLIAKNDKRQNIVELTAEGEKLYSMLAPMAEETLKEAYSGLTEEEIKQCLETLNKIQKKLPNAQDG